MSGIYKDICRIDNAPKGDDKQVLLEIIENTLEVSGSGSIEEIGDNKYRIFLFSNRASKIPKGIALDILSGQKSFNITGYKFL